MREGDGPTFTGEVRLELLKAVMEKGRPFRFTAPGSSMFPFIRDLDIITIAPLSGSCLSLGDVVAFILPDTGNLVVHRIVKREPNAFLIRGDNRAGPDGLVPRANILGTIIRVERNGRNITAGLGGERRLIAVMSRYGLLRRIVQVIRLSDKIRSAGVQKLQAQAGSPSRPEDESAG